MAIGSVNNGAALSASAIFSKMDKNGDGSLDITELGLRESEAQRGGIRAGRISDTFSSMDGDGDGLVTQSEFASFHSSLGLGLGSAAIGTTMPSLADYLNGDASSGLSNESGTSQLLQALLAQQQKAAQGDSADQDELSSLLSQLRTLLAPGAIMDIDA